MQDTLGAFVPGASVRRAPRGAGQLSGLTFAAKDLFDAVAQQAADRDLGPGTGSADLGAQVLAVTPRLRSSDFLTREVSVSGRVSAVSQKRGTAK